MQLAPLALVEGRQHRLLNAFHQGIGLRKRLRAGLRQDQLVTAAVLPVAPALHKSHPLQIVHESDHGRTVDPQLLAELPLGMRPLGIQHRQGPVVAGLETHRRDGSIERLSRHLPGLAEQKSGVARQYLGRNTRPVRTIRVRHYAPTNVLRSKSLPTPRQVACCTSYRPIIV